jgi:hypothetical protein
VQFEANGGQFISASNLAIGPPNIVARVLSFTGAQGALFFYIPILAQVNGQQVATATQINDNTSTSVVLDFGDNTLFASLGVSIPGNQVANQLTLDGALGFGFYADRLLTWGQRNRLQNLLNLGFEGGTLPTAPTVPCGWNSSANVGGALISDHFGQAWQITLATGGGSLSQSMYADALGVPIAKPNTLYRFRAWFRKSAWAPGLVFTATISSASTSFSTSVTFSGVAMSTLPAGSFLEGNFSSAMPTTIPTDLLLTIGATGSGTLEVDDLSIIYAASPYLDSIVFGSYIENPEAFDGISGKFGPAEDTHKVMDMAEIRDTLRILTQDPGGRLHETQDNGVTEPAGWTMRGVASNCGLLSAWSLAKSQADDSSASGGEQWLAWATAAGGRIFGGGSPLKISQEIQPNWIGANAAGASAWSSASGLNMAAAVTAWTLNDPATRRMYFGLPLGSAVSPSQVLHLDYRELDTAEQIASSAPIHTSYTGRLIATDHTRKWSPWNLALNGASLMYRGSGVLQAVFFGGTNAYILDATKLTDDDFGQIFPSYTTYFFVTRDQEGALSCEMMMLDPATGKRVVTRMPLGGGRKILSYLQAFVSGTGQVTITPLCDTLINPWSVICTRPLSLAPGFDLEWSGGNCQAQRIALRFASSPFGTGVTDNGFSLQKVLAALRIARLPIRGSAT